jgi:ADP-ribosylglycohydrolase
MTIRNAVSLGGDADTQACIAGAIAEAFWGGVPDTILSFVLPRLDERMLGIVTDFASRYLPEQLIISNIISKLTISDQN